MSDSTAKPESVMCRGCFEDITLSQENPTMVCPKCGTENLPGLPLIPEPPPEETLPQIETEPLINSNLWPCNDCGRLVSKRATTCPNCGATLQHKRGIGTWLVYGLVGFFGLMVIIGMFGTSSKRSSPTVSTGETVVPTAARQLLNDGEAAIRRGEYSHAASLLNRIVAEHPSTREEAVVQTLLFVLREKTSRSGPMTVEEAGRISGYIQTLEKIQNGYHSTTASKQEALDTIFGPGVMGSGNSSLDMVATAHANLMKSRKEALGTSN
jgi:RNA polymerase subunit RPABC4/transcription elongation factor Spt4